MNKVEYTNEKNERKLIQLHNNVILLIYINECDILWRIELLINIGKEIIILLIYDYSFLFNYMLYNKKMVHVIIFFIKLNDYYIYGVCVINVNLYLTFVMKTKR